jgi:hypothetical protein
MYSYILLIMVKLYAIKNCEEVDIYINILLASELTGGKYFVWVF